MEKLIELTAIINRNKTKSISIIGNGMEEDTKLMQLYSGIATGKVSSDDEAFNYVYPNSKDRNPYYKLKHQLRERLKNTAFFVDAKQTKFSNIRKAYLECQILLCTAAIMKTLGGRSNAQHYAEKALKIALKYEFIQERLSAAKILANYYALSSKVKMLKELQHIISSNEMLFIKENRANLYWQEMLSIYAQDRSTKKHVNQLCIDYLNKLDELKSTETTSNLIFYSGLIEITKFFSINDYENASRVCEEVLDKIRNYHFKNSTAIFNISLQYIACCIALKRYPAGLKVITEILSLTEPGAFNWQKVKEMHFILAMHSNQYGEGAKILAEVNGLPKNKKLRIIQETWNIFQAYTHFLKEAGHIPVDATSGKRSFRLQRYLNDVPIFSKDKRGQNVPILISHILLLLQQKRYNQLIDRCESIGKYRDRYLDKENNYRSNIFVRMLLEIPKGDFKRSLVLERTEKLIPLLNEVPVDMTSQRHDQEILPYETTWELALDLLD